VNEVKKILIFVLILLFYIPSSKYVVAETNLTNVRNLPQNAYTEDGKIKISSDWFGENNKIFDASLELLQNIIPKQRFYGADDTEVIGVMSYPNITEAKEGYFDLQWVFTPNNSDIYETKTGIIHYKLFLSEPRINDSFVEDAAITLTASTLMLTTDSSFDVNIENKEFGSTYKWSSKDTTVAKVNKSGVVTALDEGSTEVICEVVNPIGEKTVLSTDVVVGTDDDNSPTLTEDELTLDVGELFDVNVENSIKGSKYKWTSSDKTIAKVTSTSGKITGLKQGEVIITCVITTPDKAVFVLTCSVGIE
jgi:hypothetical protein